MSHSGVAKGLSLLRPDAVEWIVSSGVSNNIFVSSLMILLWPFALQDDALRSFETSGSSDKEAHPRIRGISILNNTAVKTSDVEWEILRFRTAVFLENSGLLGRDNV